MVRIPFATLGANALDSWPDLMVLDKIAQLMHAYRFVTDNFCAGIDPPFLKLMKGNASGCCYGDGREYPASRDVWCIDGSWTKVNGISLITSDS